MDERLKIVLVESGDGSHTLRVPALKEHYHSHKGAIQESRHVFLEMGLSACNAAPINLLEVGFGTGLNALLTCLDSKTRINYHTLEPFPLKREVWSVLNYPSLIADSNARDAFNTLHESPWGEEVEINANFKLYKHEMTLEAFEPTLGFDLVYYDAFAPHAQAELWRPEVWSKLIEMMNPGGLIVTYCAKAQVRRDLISTGFNVERLPGPPGKREMLRAVKP